MRHVEIDGRQVADRPAVQRDGPTVLAGRSLCSARGVAHVSLEARSTRPPPPMSRVRVGWTAGRDVQRFPAMGDQIDFDERIAAQLEVVYRTRDIKRRRALAQEALAPEPGDEVLDVGCGPGFYVGDIHDIVGANGSVTGVDASPALPPIPRREGRDR